MAKAIASHPVTQSLAKAAFNHITGGEDVEQFDLSENEEQWLSSLWNAAKAVATHPATQAALKAGAKAVANHFLGEEMDDEELAELMDDDEWLSSLWNAAKAVATHPATQAALKAGAKAVADHFLKEDLDELEYYEDILA